MPKTKARHAKAKTRKERTALIDEAVAMTHYSRKYVIRLPNGSRRHRRHRGRKPSYSRDAHRLPSGSGGRKATCARSISRA